MVGSTGTEIRACTRADWPAVLNVINADRLPGQPATTSAMLRDAVHGRSEVDQGFWDELDEIRIDVLVSPSHGVLGAVSFARHPPDGDGVLLWLHGHEDPGIVRELLEHVLRQLADCRAIEAFSFATALSLGLEALPVAHRPNTDQALRAAGFLGEDLWRFMRRTLPAEDLPRAKAVETERKTEHERRLHIHEHGELVAEATIGLPIAGIGALWWIGVEPAARGRGLGKALLGSALAALAEAGAEQVILYVDDDDPDPHSHRGRHAANRLYEQAGFAEVDRLVSYQLRAASAGS